MCCLKEFIIFSDNILRRTPADHYCFAHFTSSFLYQLALGSHSIGQGGRLQLRPCRVWSSSGVCDHVVVPGEVQVAADNADTRCRDDGLSQPETNAIPTHLHASYNFRSLQ